MKNKSKLLIVGLLLFSIFVLTNCVTNGIADNTIITDPHDPGNSPGPGQLPPDSNDIIVPIQFIFEESELSLSLLNNHIL